MKAFLKNFRQSPRKVRLVADMIRGKSVTEALSALRFMPKKSSPDILKLLESAVANARQQGAAAEDLFVKTITVDKGLVMRRFMPKARGRAARFARTSSHVQIELGTKIVAEKPVAKKTAKKAAKKAAKKVAAKSE